MHSYTMLYGLGLWGEIAKIIGSLLGERSITFNSTGIELQHKTRFGFHLHPALAVCC